jgi:tRNA A-37 threonylcarbamoyl transferase component Bud32
VVGAVLIGLVVAARLYLASDHPTDALVGVALGTAIPLLAFRLFAPDQSFPVSYRQRKSAHLDIDARRADAIRLAVSDQLGLHVVDMGPIGLAGSGGSTPLRLRLDDGTAVFGKLYAKNHVRADRWYKTFRTILYGRLEDEAPFQSVRRLAQQEDYTLRVMRDAGVPSAAPLGVVELTPEREYLVVTEFFEGSKEITDAEVDDDVIDQGLAVVRKLWDSGLAHRDIKPANVLVRDGQLLLIDVAFAQVRPSPWREAVDLANMMLVLGVCTDAERVYARALHYFTPDEIAEAFAAARGIASPTQLRNVMRHDGRDLVGQFRALAPPRRPISLQRWGPRRILYALGLLVAAALLIPATLSLFTPTELSVSSPPTCNPNDVMVLMAQSVPTSTQLPCLNLLPGGWTAGTVSIHELQARFTLDSDQVGESAVVVTLTPSCSTGGAREEASELPGIRRFATPDVRGEPAAHFYLVAGGCITHRFSAALTEDVASHLIIDAALWTLPREKVVERVESDAGLALCGALAPPCEGGSP